MAQIGVNLRNCLKTRDSLGNSFSFSFFFTLSRSRSQTCSGLTSSTTSIRWSRSYLGDRDRSFRDRSCPGDRDRSRRRRRSRDRRRRPLGLRLLLRLSRGILFKKNSGGRFKNLILINTKSYQHSAHYVFKYMIRISPYNSLICYK